MSDDVFEIVTPFGDVAELGQGYINRADGERMLLPLPSECAAGEGVRFIVHLTDGTPAFAGAGRCVQVSDQGATVVAAERFETLLDNLAFDDRSRPVYDYIVAVRQAAYTAGGPEALEAQPAEQQVLLEAGEEPTAFSQAGEQAAAELLASSEEEPTAFIESAASMMGHDSDAPVALVDESVAEILTTSIPVPASFSEPAAELLAPSQPAPESEVAFASEPAPSEVEAEAAFASEPAPSESAFASEPAPARAPSSVPPALPDPLPPEPLPTGILKRPALASHWQPEPPRPPQPMRGTGLFRYPPGPLPVPAHPPRPDLDPALCVQPAPAPAA